jgi:DUF4097 and DUF4098 domain-containing protein YvlB
LDVRGAENTQVEFSGGRLLVRGPKQRSFIGRTESVDVTIQLPAGSHVRGASAIGAFDCQGPLGSCRIKTDYGNIRLDETRVLQANTAYGDVTVDLVVGDADIATASGELRIGRITGAGMIKNSDGDITVGEVSGDLLVRTANGNISVDRAHSSVTVKSANGDLRIGDVTGGPIVAETACGEISVGIHQGTEVWLDVSTAYGHVRNTMEASEGPKKSEAAVEVRARTSYGDIVISRSTT